MKIILMICLLCSNLMNSQVGIGKASVDGSGILDFPLGTTNGILLPIVEALPTSAVNGTILMDKNDAKIKFRSNNAWIEMSATGSTSSVIFNNGSEGGDGVVIGNYPSAAEGILVLEATDKALILPKVVSPEINVKNPYPGTLVYDLTSKSIALFDGLKWNYLK